MKTLKEKVNGIVLCLFELIAGILLLINPISFTSGIIVFTGVILIIYGLIEVVKYFRVDAEEASQKQMLVKGLVIILIGGFCAIKSGWFIVTFPILTIIYGVSTLLTGIGKIEMTVDMLRQKNKKWFWAAINAVISIVCAIIILNSPFSSTAALWLFTGISLIVEGIFDIITVIMGGKAENRRHK